MQTKAEGRLYNSLAYQIYCTYVNALGKQPDSFEDTIQFQFSGTPREYEKVSLVDVLEGNVDLLTFKNSIVLVGAYAPGMQDSFHVSVDHGEQMYGVEVHANIVESLLTGKIVKNSKYIETNKRGRAMYQNE